MNYQSVGYIRVSSESQCTDRQLAEIELHRKFIEIDSGNKKDRPILKECIDYLREGDTLFIHSIDRLARNLRHLQELLNTLLAKKVNVQFLKERLLFNSSNDVISMLMFQMMGAFAEFERNMIRERQKEGIAQAIKAGKHMGRPPMLTVFHKKKAKEMKENGLSIREISRQLGFSRMSIYKLLELGKYNND